MLRFVKEFFYGLTNLRLRVAHQTEKKRAFLMLGLLVAAGTGIGMSYYGYVLTKIFLGTTLSFFATIGVTYSLFTDALKHLFRSIDDIINPPRPVTLPYPIADPNKVLEHKALLEEIKAIDCEKIDIRVLKEKFKKLFELRSYFDIDDNALDGLFKEYLESYNNLLNNIKNEKSWDEPEILKKLPWLMTKGIIFSEALLARMEAEMREKEQEINTRSISANLINQSNRFCRVFLYAGAIDLYHVVRGRIFYTTMGDSEDTMTLVHYPKNLDYQSKFYQKESPENNLRKMYNAFVKHGFYHRYGDKAFMEQLSNDDNRFKLWTEKDKNIQEFCPMPGKRPT